MGWLYQRVCCCCSYRRRALFADPFLTPTTRQSFASAVSEDDVEQPPYLETGPDDAATATDPADLQRDISQAAYNAKFQHTIDMATPGTSKQWREGSVPGTKWWTRTKRNQPRVETTVIGELQTASQVEELPMVQLTPDGGLLGALPTLLELGNWPEWMFMCEAATVHHRWGPGEILGDLCFKLPLGMRLEVTAYVCLVNRLEDEGYLDFVVCSSGSALGRPYATFVPPGSPEAGKCTSFLGVPLSLSRSKWRIRTDVDFSVLRFYPVGRGGLHHHVSFVLVGEERCPMDNIVCMIWGQVFKHLVAVLARHATSGTRHVDTESDLAFYAGLERDIAAAAQRAEARTRGEQLPPQVAQETGQAGGQDGARKIPRVSSTSTLTTVTTMAETNDVMDGTETSAASFCSGGPAREPSDIRAGSSSDAIRTHTC